VLPVGKRRPPLRIRPIAMPMRRPSTASCRCGCSARLANFVFILGTGRSGSTSLMWLLNALPGVHIAGENMGIGNLLAELSQSAVETERRSRIYAGWASRIDAPRVQCGLVRLLLRLVNPPPGARIIGFKTIRVFERAYQLATLLPCARFVVNVRGDRHTQRKSSFFRLRSKAAERGLLENRTTALLAFADEHRNNSFVVRTEDLTIRGTQGLLNWLGLLDADGGDAHAGTNDGASRVADLDGGPFVPSSLRFDANKHRACPTIFDRRARRAIPPADPCARCPALSPATAYLRGSPRQQHMPFGNCTVLRVPRVDGVASLGDLAKWQLPDARHEGIVSCMRPAAGSRS
jgi:hypothetical protein